jgi:NADH dehydrogenase
MKLCTSAEKRSQEREGNVMHDHTAGKHSQGKDTAAKAVVITGAFSYTGKYTTRLLLGRGYKIRTLTYHPERANPFGHKVQVFPYTFDDPERLKQALVGASTLINTYWVRFPRGNATFEGAVQNTRRLIQAAKKAGVRRIVHVSIANPSLESNLGYYRGKAQLEQAVVESGLAHTILRPTVIFGLEDILINNIAWFVHHLPAFAIPGDGQYRIRPIFVEDMARLMADAVEREGNLVLDAIGPETYTFEELVKTIAAQMRRRIRLLHVPMPAAYVATRLTGWLVGDVVLTWEEYQGLMDGLLAPEGPPAGETRLSEWLVANRDHVGVGYASEVARHYARMSAKAS